MTSRAHVIVIKSTQQLNQHTEILLEPKIKAGNIDNRTMISKQKTHTKTGPPTNIILYKTTHLKIGAKNTQMSRIWTGMFNVCNNQCIPPDVIINPGYTVPPTILPNGYQARSSNQFKKS